MSDDCGSSHARSRSKKRSTPTWGDLRPTQEQRLLQLLQQITATTNLEDLLDHIVFEMPRFLRLEACEVYLTHEFVPQFTDVLIDADGKEVSAVNIDKPFVVLAQTNQHYRHSLVGRMYWAAGEEFIGWVLVNRMLNLKDITDEGELRGIDPPLQINQKLYRGTSTKLDDKKVPALFIPFTTLTETIGVLGLRKKRGARAFSKAEEQIAVIVGQVIAGLIQKNQILTDQQNTILQLTEISTEDNPEIVGEKITASIQTMLSCQHSDLYTLDQSGNCVTLKFRDGKVYDKDPSVCYCPGIGLIGWVLKTGKPLLIDDIRQYNFGKRLTHELLLKISDGSEINEDDDWLEVADANKTYVSKTRLTSPFLAVPILDPDGSIQGVLSAHFVSSRLPDRVQPFTRLELQQVKTFASAYALNVQNDLTRRKAEFLLRMNQSESLEDLNNLVIETLPKLIRCSDCFIFSVNRDGELPPVQLVNSSRGQIDLNYEIGESKTGFCALSKRTLVFAHYGAGIVRSVRLKEQMTRLMAGKLEDFVLDLFDEERNSVGYIQLRDGKSLDAEIQKQFTRLRKEQYLSKDGGLPSRNLDQYLASGGSPSFSFVAVPIVKQMGSEISGVITFYREYKFVPFGDEDIRFVESIAASFASMIELLKVQESRKKLLWALAHEITTPILALRSSAESITLETSKDNIIYGLGIKIIEQVNLLELTSETILGVIGGRRIGKRFTPHSLFRPIMDAREMFLDEAAFKRCDIEKPRTLNVEGFPNIEMRLTELMLAFKNLLHNAVKYSFFPPVGQERNRFIRIIGDWADIEKHYYKVSFQNFGVGITEEETLSRNIFRHFVRGRLSSDRFRTGSGFGLAYAQIVVDEIHNGYIEVTSKPMGGEAYLTTFTVELPVQQSYGKRKRG